MPDIWHTYTGEQLPNTLDVAWLWHKRMPAGHVNFLGASGGAGKSLLGMALGLSITNELPFLDAETQRGTVLYYDFEADATAVGHMLHKVRRGLGLSPRDVGRRFVYRSPSPAGSPVLDHERLESIADEVRAGGVELVVIDAWTSAFWNVRSNSTEEVAAKMADLRALAALGAAVLIIDHTPKPIANGPNAVDRGIIGSTMKLAGARAGYMLARVAPKDVDGRDVLALHCLKNNLGPIPDPLGIERAWTDDAVTFHVTDLPEAESGATGRMRAQAAVREALDEGETIARRDLVGLVTQRANVQTRTVEAAIARLIAAGEVEALPHPTDRRARVYQLAGAAPGKVA